MAISNYLLGQKISSIRLNLGLSQEQFAERIGDITNNETITKGTVNNWEHGRNKPNKARQLAIAKLGNISLDELINDERGLNLWEKSTGFNQKEIDNQINKGIESNRINADDDIQKQIGQAVNMLEFNGSPDLKVIHDIDNSLLKIGNEIDTYYIDPKKWITAPVFGDHHIIPRNGKISNYFYDDMNKEINLKIKKIIKKSRIDIRNLVNEYHLNDTNE